MDGFLVVLHLFHKCVLKVITNLKFDKRCFIKDHIRKHICIIEWCLVRQ
jgi:hypothetical protein